MGRPSKQPLDNEARLVKLIGRSGATKSDLTRETHRFMSVAERDAILERLVLRGDVVEVSARSSSRGRTALRYVRADTTLSPKEEFAVARAIIIAGEIQQRDLIRKLSVFSALQIAGAVQRLAARKWVAISSTKHESNGKRSITYSSTIQGHPPVPLDWRVTPGFRFGGVRVIGCGPPDGHKQSWVCLCDCDPEVERLVPLRCVQSGHCGCMHRERAVEGGCWNRALTLLEQSLESGVAPYGGDVYAYWDLLDGYQSETALTA